jgi:acetyl esterase/lipase
MFRTVKLLFQPIIDALFKPGIRWEYRWRLLLLQPIAILTCLLTAPPWLFSRAYTVCWIPTREGRSVRALLFRPARRHPDKLHPLHLDIHGGGFLGGLPEYEARFTSLLCERTGAVVVSAQYRYAPGHPFPAAIDDIDDVVRYMHQNAERLWGADPNVMTISGFSAGGNLALAACQQASSHSPAPTAVKASVTFYAPVGSLCCISGAGSRAHKPD